MKKIILISIPLVAIIIFATSPGTKRSYRDYRFDKSGLIYNSNNNELYTGTVIDTGDVVIEFEVVNGKKNGAFKTYYFNGQLEKSGYMVNDYNVGKWTYYYPNGQISTEGNFKNDMAEGKWISYYENGNKMCEGLFKNGKQEYEWIYYYENGQIINILCFKDGIFIGLVRKFA